MYPFSIEWGNAQRAKQKYENEMLPFLSDENFFLNTFEIEAKFPTEVVLCEKKCHLNNTSAVENVYFRRSTPQLEYLVWL